MSSLPTGVSHNRFPALDGYRAIAAYMIVGTHVAFLSGEVVRSTIGKVFGRFDFGVAIFFLLSGFLLFRAFSRQSLNQAQAPSRKVYYLRRFMRVMPAYWVACLVILFATPGLDPTRSQIIANLTLTQIYVPDTQVPPLGQTWSLATEISFYLVLPIIAWLTTLGFAKNAQQRFQRQLWILAIMFIIGAIFQVLLRFGPLTDYPLMGLWLPAYLCWFSLGMACAVLQVAYGQGMRNRIVRAWDVVTAETSVCVVIGVCLFIIAATPISGTYTLDPDPGFYRLVKHALYGASALFILLPGFRGEVRGPWLSFLSTRFMRWLGTISFGVFLWHIFAIDWIMKLTGMELFYGNFWILLILSLLASTLLGWLSWILIEKHAIGLSHRFREVPSNEETTADPKSTSDVAATSTR